jgi:hypothetical protein
MLLRCKIESNKPNDMLKHLMMLDSLGLNWSMFYSKIVSSGSVGEDDETYLTFKKH